MGANGTLTGLSSHAPWALQRRPWRPHEQAAQRGERQATVPDRGAAGVPASCGLHHDPTKCTELMGHATRCPHGPAAPLRRYHGEPAGEHWSLLFCEFGSGGSRPLAGSMGVFFKLIFNGLSLPPGEPPFQTPGPSHALQRKRAAQSKNAQLAYRLVLRGREPSASKAGSESGDSRCRRVIYDSY